MNMEFIQNVYSVVQSYTIAVGHLIKENVIKFVHYAPMNYLINV